MTGWSTMLLVERVKAQISYTFYSAVCHTSDSNFVTFHPLPSLSGEKKTNIGQSITIDLFNSQVLSAFKLCDLLLKGRDF